MHLQKYFFETLAILLSHKNRILFIFFLFILVFFYGFFSPDMMSPRDMEKSAEVLGGWLTKYGQNFFTLSLFIFGKNCLTIYFWMRLGTLYGLPALLGTLFNGAFAGTLVGTLAQEQGSASILWLLVPHGIFEIPAFSIALGMGLSIGIARIQRKGKDRLKDIVRQAHVIFIFLVIPLLWVAGLIEAGSLILRRGE